MGCQAGPSQWLSQPSVQAQCCVANQRRPVSRACRSSSNSASGRSASSSHPRRTNCVGKPNNYWDKQNSRVADTSSTGASKYALQRRPGSAGGRRGGRRGSRTSKGSHAADWTNVGSSSKAAIASATLPTEQHCCHSTEHLTTAAIIAQRTAMAAIASRSSHRQLRPARSLTKLTSGQCAAPATRSVERPSSATSNAARSSWAFRPSRASPCNGDQHDRTSMEASNLCSDGLWFEWQHQDVSGSWNSVGVQANRALEEAYTFGEPICCFWSNGVLRKFDLRAGQEMGSSAHIQRVRMPQGISDTGDTQSTCSTHMVSSHMVNHPLDFDENSVFLEEQLSIPTEVCWDG